MRVARRGTLVVLEREQLPRYLGFKLSPHQVDLREVLALAELRDCLPEKLVAIGLQPVRIEMLSGAQSGGRRPAWIGCSRQSIERLGRWGHPAAPLERLAQCMS